jgi:hypothetical protein
MGHECLGDAAPDCTMDCTQETENKNISRKIKSLVLILAERVSDELSVFDVRYRPPTITILHEI